MKVSTDLDRARRLIKKLKSEDVEEILFFKKFCRSIFGVESFALSGALCSKRCEEYVQICLAIDEFWDEVGDCDFFRVNKQEDSSYDPKSLWTPYLKGEYMGIDKIFESLEKKKYELR